ncbi:uncharacterized protein LOC115357665 isoform X1 [Myripristis murdjan]|uniref:uncharacterized protein LOC115357665 isoform X1 n=1 Tax=Myripristis murdjan TaxID=586833 RepID=UPI00117607FB|nr:uncharacterized protein LOC115357665 isoform X1 [Myripristis murdjan]
MDALLLLLSLALCGGVSARSRWSEKPWISVSSPVVVAGEWLTVLCGVPIDYTGGECRLYRGDARTPLSVMTTHDYVCRFVLPVRRLMRRLPVGGRTSVRCDYHLQSYTSESSDNTALFLWESVSAPVLSVSSQVVSVEGSVEVRCSSSSSPSPSVCHFSSDRASLGWASCSANLTARRLAAGQQAAPLLPVRLSCSYEQEELHRRSEPSEPLLLLLLDVSQLAPAAPGSNSSTVLCEAEGAEPHMNATNLPDGLTLILRPANGSSPLNTPCTYL